MATAEETANAFKMQWLDTVASELIDLGFAADAIPLLSEAVKLAQVVDLSTLPTVTSQTSFRLPLRSGST